MNLRFVEWIKHHVCGNRVKRSDVGFQYNSRQDDNHLECYIKQLDSILSSQEKDSGYVYRLESFKQANRYSKDGLLDFFGKPFEVTCRFPYNVGLEKKLPWDFQRNPALLESYYSHGNTRAMYLYESEEIALEKAKNRLSEFKKTGQPSAIEMNNFIVSRFARCTPAIDGMEVHDDNTQNFASYVIPNLNCFEIPHCDIDFRFNGRWLPITEATKHIMMSVVKTCLNDKQSLSLFLKKLHFDLLDDH